MSEKVFVITAHVGILQRHYSILPKNTPERIPPLNPAIRRGFACRNDLDSLREDCSYNLDYRDKQGNPKPVKFASYICKRIDGFIIDYLKKELNKPTVPYDGTRM